FIMDTIIIEPQWIELRARLPRHLVELIRKGAGDPFPAAFKDTQRASLRQARGQNRPAIPGTDDHHTIAVLDVADWYCHWYIHRFPSPALLPKHHCFRPKSRLSAKRWRRVYSKRCCVASEATCPMPKAPSPMVSVPGRPGVYLRSAK